MNTELMIKAGGKIWEKGTAKRIYFSTSDQIAEVIGYKIVQTATYAEQMTSRKTKSYFDVVNSVFYADCGEIANALRAVGFSVKRI